MKTHPLSNLLIVPTPLIVYSETLSLLRGQLLYTTTKKNNIPLEAVCIPGRQYYNYVSVYFLSDTTPEPPTTRTPYPSLLFLSTNCRKLIVLAYSVTTINST